MDIDFVVLWVDGSDPAWLAEKQRFQPAKKKEDNDNGANRYRDWGLMQYWFRAVEKFAPWVRTVHFVTWGHLPPFLNTENPRLHIVRHEDYMPAEALPCFNSCALEMNLHRIPGLAEHFVYFNDDVFLTQPTSPDDFFDTKTGLPRAQFCEMPCCFQRKLETYNVHMARAVGLVNKWFPKAEIPWKRYWRLFLNRAYPMADNIRTFALRLLYPHYFSGFRVFHTCFPYRRSTFEAVWQHEPELLQHTTRTRFRGWEEVNQYFPYMWQLVSGSFSPGRVSLYLASIRPDTIEDICEAITRQRCRTVCLNDSEALLDFEKLSRRLNAAFAEILPETCSFEI